MNGTLKLMDEHQVLPLARSCIGRIPQQSTLAVPRLVSLTLHERFLAVLFQQRRSAFPCSAPLCCVQEALVEERAHASSHCGPALAVRQHKEVSDSLGKPSGMAAAAARDAGARSAAGLPENLGPLGASALAATATGSDGSDCDMALS
ncbi:hypothetical protein CGC20_37380 [Leishmania donovani]|uniref:Uncharacterized protein n=1 Tax=Leishmania donovani TaxID=5661 RepID=A0A504Y320_LEIDO|nr:hypothetical protein CGC20_37380 [Leishmania donovani]